MPVLEYRTREPSLMPQNRTYRPGKAPGNAVGQLLELQGCMKGISNA